MKVNKRNKKTRQIRREKVCSFCEAKKKTIGWRDYEKLGEFLSIRGRILGSPITGVCVRHQRALGVAVKRARHLGLMPFSVENV